MENKERVKTILTQLKQNATLDLDGGNLVSNGILDSLDIMNLIMELESQFDIEIDPEDVLSENFETVEAIVALVEKCKG